MNRRIAACLALALTPALTGGCDKKPQPSARQDFERRSSKVVEDMDKYAEPPEKAPSPEKDKPADKPAIQATPTPPPTTTSPPPPAVPPGSNGPTQPPAPGGPPPEKP